MVIFYGFECNSPLENCPLWAGVRYVQVWLYLYEIEENVVPNMIFDFYVLIVVLIAHMRIM